MSKHPEVWIAMDNDGTRDVRAHVDEPTICESGEFDSNGSVWVCEDSARKLGLLKLLVPGRKAKFKLVHVDSWDETWEE